MRKPILEKTASCTHAQTLKTRGCAAVCCSKITPRLLLGGSGAHCPSMLKFPLEHFSMATLGVVDCSRRLRTSHLLQLATVWLQRKIKPGRRDHPLLENVAKALVLLEAHFAPGYQHKLFSPWSPDLGTRSNHGCSRRSVRSRALCACGVFFYSFVKCRGT